MIDELQFCKRKVFAFLKGAFMLTLTEKAGNHLKKMLEQSAAPEDQCIRVSAQGQSLALTLGSKEPGDKAYEHDGRTVLVVNEELAQHLEDRKVDVDGAGDNAQLVLS
jgi:Fe-S cluster assembly iron-binding protein IscA